MHYHIILTEKCNSQCRYCYEKSLKEFDNELDKKFDFDFSSPCTSNIDIKKLKQFLEKDENPTIIFYGGEPLLQIEKIKKIIDECSKIKNIKFRMQTNAKLINNLPIEYTKKITKILVSLDGNKQRTDFNRGEGTYDLVINNLKELKEQGYEGEIIARMTVANDLGHDIEEQVKSLLKEKNINSVHWQIDAGFYKFDYDKDKIELFFKKYNDSISKLINYWLKEMEKGNFLKIYPFIGITNRLLKLDEEDCLMCGAGKYGYAISTDGKIVACPIMNSIKNFEAGDLNKKDSNPKNLKKFKINHKDCKICEERKICGGRCLYWRESNLWPEEGNKIVCNSIKHLISELKKNITKIESIVEDKNNPVTIRDFQYEKYFGPEIIP